MSAYRCPYCDSSDIFEDFNGQALKCANCDEFGTEEDFITKPKKDRIRRVKKFDDELPIEIDNESEFIESQVKDVEND